MYPKKVGKVSTNCSQSEECSKKMCLWLQGGLAAVGVIAQKNEKLLGFAGRLLIGLIMMISCTIFPCMLMSHRWWQFLVWVQVPHSDARLRLSI